ncbi:MAG: hypothetical protein JWN73_3641 [Betaproteobacteria bacterium]|nr:hypothetical protein [Betaproteobacteria bacterium]
MVEPAAARPAQRGMAPSRRGSVDMSASAGKRRQAGAGAAAPC